PGAPARAAWHRHPAPRPEPAAPHRRPGPTRTRRRPGRRAPRRRRRSAEPHPSDVRGAPRRGALRGPLRARRGGTVPWHLLSRGRPVPATPERVRDVQTRSAPDVVRDRDDLADLRPLLILGEHIALLGRGEAALRAQRQLIEADEDGSLVDALLDAADVLELAGLGGDQPEHDGLVAFGQEPQRLEPSGALTVVLQEVAVVVDDAQQLLGDRLVAPGRDPGRAEVPPAH